MLIRKILFPTGTLSATKLYQCQTALEQGSKWWSVRESTKFGDFTGPFWGPKSGPTYDGNHNKRTQKRAIKWTQVWVHVWGHPTLVSSDLGPRTIDRRYYSMDALSPSPSLAFLVTVDPPSLLCKTWLPSIANANASPNFFARATIMRWRQAHAP
jgi:hypothetical protein